MTLSVFHNFEHLKPVTQKLMASFAMPFSSLVCMHTKHLAMKRNHYSRLLN